MICVLRPRPPSSGGSSKKNSCNKEQRYVTPERYDGAQRLASPSAPQDPDNGGFLATESPPRLLGASGLGGCRTNTDKTPAQLAVIAIQSAGDVHEIKDFNSGEIGALCVAVVRQSLRQASREIWFTTRGGAAMAKKPKSIRFGGEPSGVSSAGAALQAMLRRHAQAFAPRRSEGVQQQHPEACLVLYCKLAGGVMFASPLDGSAFCLRQQLPIAEDEEALAREATTETQLTNWTLPPEGFEALIDLEKSVVPGLPALARDMANDEKLAAELGCGLTPLSEEVSFQFRDGDENRTQRVVVPRVGGIVFASLDPAAASTASRHRGSTSVGGSDASLRVAAVLARLEQADGQVEQRFVLEDFDVFGDDGAGEVSSGTGRRVKRSTKGRTRRLPLPTTYAALLEEATSPRPSPGPSIVTRILRRWRRGSKHQAGVNRIVPGAGELAVLERKQQQPFSRAGKLARSEEAPTSSGESNRNRTSADTVTCGGEGNCSSRSDESEKRLLSVGDVMSASLTQAALWASTRDVVWAMLVAACRPRGNSCGTPETQQSTVESPGGSCAAARRAACALLGRVFGNVNAGEQKNGQSTTGIGGEEASAALDWWYEGFRAATAPPCGGDGLTVGAPSFLLQAESPRLLLEDMLEIPTVRAAFVGRGLARHLADVLRVGLLEMKNRELNLCYHTHIRHAPDGEAPSCGMSMLPEEDPGISSAEKCRGRVMPRKRSDGKANLPWWLLFSQGRGKQGAGGRGHGHGHGFSETSKNVGESAGGVGVEADGRSCQTALDEIFAPEREKEERGAQTSRDVDPAADSNSLCSAGGMPVSAAVTKRENREREEGAYWDTASGGGAASTKTGRVAPPMLRLDALGAILDTAECASARFCSSHAVASLSAASTRAASEHLPTFSSARGATSRASARHGSGRSVRTGRTTQRDSIASTGCSTVRSTSPSATADLEVAAAPPAPLSPPPSSCYSDGEPVRCCEERGGGAGGCGGAAATRPRSVPDGQAGVGQVPGGSIEGIVVDGADGLHPGGGDRKAGVASAVPARRGEGGGSGSGREGMPRLHLEELPANGERPVSRVVGANVGSVIGGPNPPVTTAGQGHLSKSAARPDDVEAVSRGKLPSTTESSAGFDRRPGTRETPKGDIDGGALECRLPDASSGNVPIATDYVGFHDVPHDNTPAALVLNLARSSAPGQASCSSPSQTQQAPMSISHVFRAERATATLLVSMLPSTPVEHHPEESLLVALDVLSSVGTLSWIDGAEARAAVAATTTTYGGKPATGPTSRHTDDSPEALWEPKPTAVWPPELNSVDLTLLAHAAGRHLDFRLSALQSLFSESHQGDKDEEMASYTHQRRVHDACRLVLECTWLTRLILRSVMAASALDDKLRSALSARAAGDTLRFCGGALGMLQRCMRNAFPLPLLSASARRSAVANDGVPEESPEDSPEVPVQNEGCAAEALLLAAPVVADLAALLVVLVRQPMAWGEDLAWAARTLGSGALCCNGGDGSAIPALGKLLGHLVTEARTQEGDPRQSVGSEGGHLQRVPHGRSPLPEAAEILEKGLTGSRAVLDHLLVAVLDSIAAVLSRAKILMDISEDASQGVLGSAPAVATARMDTAQKETSEAVARLARGLERLLQPGGPVLTILEMQFSNDTLLGGDTNPDELVAAMLETPPPRRVVPVSCAMAALRLSTVFFSLCGTADTRSEARLASLEDFVGPIFSGFRRQWGGFVAARSPGVVPAVPPAEQGRRVGGEARQEPTAREPDEPTWSARRKGLCLCRLNLEALVELAATQDPAVLRRLDERRVAPFILRRVLAIGDGAQGRQQEPLGSLDAAAQGSEEGRLILDGSEIAAPAPRRTGQPGNVSHSVRGGSGDTPERAQALGSAAAGYVLHAGAPLFSVGDRVEGLVSVKSGRPRWFLGRVERVNGVDGTVHVCYDDGDEEPHKDPGEVRPSRRKTTDGARRQLRSGIGQQNPGGKETPATTAPVTSSLDTIVQHDRQRRAGTEGTALRPGRSPAVEDLVSSVDGLRRAETAGGAPQSPQARIYGKSGATEKITPGAAADGGRPPVTVEVSAGTALSGEHDSNPGAAVSSPAGSGNSAENESEDDDAYFVIPSVLDAAAAAGTDSIRPFLAVDSSSPMSVVPRIDLQSPVFRTRVFSSQLGPGSSLSTPTTGGGRVPDTLRRGGGSRSEASLSTPSFPSRRSSQAQRPPSFIARPLRSSGVTRSASVLSDSDPSSANPRGLERQIARLLSIERKTSSSEEEKDDDEEDELGSSTSEADGRCPTRQVSRGADEVAETGRGHAAAATTTPGVQAGVAEPPSDEKTGHLDGDAGAPTTTTCSRSDDDIRVIKGLAITLLLILAATPSNAASLGWGYSSPPLSKAGAEKQEDGGVARLTSLLQEFFDDGRNDGIVPVLRARWCSTVKSTAESAPAVLAKLICAPLFDSQSYALDGDHVSAGRFGEIIVSKCPLRLGARLCHASVQVCAVTSAAMGPREEPESSPTLPPRSSSLSSASSPSESRRDAAAADETDEVALKVIERDELDSNIGANVFVEALALRTLADVPGVCRLYDFGVTPASYVLVIERCVGSLKEWRLARSAGGDSGGGDGDSTFLGAPRSDEEAALYLLVFRQIVSTVAVMAERGVIHFDLKCENILVRRSSASGPPLACSFAPPTVHDGSPYAEQDAAPSVCVADFGESVIGRRHRRRSQHTRTVGADAGGDSSRETPTADSATGDDFFFDVRGARGTERIQSPEMVLLSGGGGQPARPGSGSGGARDENEGAAGRITPASDVWSLGCLLYELLSMQPLFDDLQWSEFFVTLTAGGAVVGPTGGGDHDAGPAQVVSTHPHPLPPPRRLRPFAALGCVEALRQLLAAMLIRNPAERPSASETVRYVDEALAGITSSISEKQSRDSAGSDASVTTTGKPPLMCPREGDGRTSPSSRTPNADDLITVSNHTPAATSTPLQPCTAVAAHRSLVAERSALLGCDGCLNRLGAGAFLLTGPAGGRGTRNSTGNQIFSLSNNPDQERSAWPQVGPETKVWCSAADCGYSILGGETKPCMGETGVSRYTLGSVLPTLGIGHVVCVVARQADMTGTRRCSSAPKQNASCEPQTPVSPLPGGWRLLRVFVPTTEDAAEGEEGRGGPRSRISRPDGMARVVRDVVEFATGPRVLFVGGDDGGCDDVAGALAMVWAMARTGKGSYETMLDFRQRCAGFYVDETVLKPALGCVERGHDGRNVEGWARRALVGLDR